MKIKYLIAVGVLLSVLVACDETNPQPCNEERAEAAILAEFPDSIKVGNVHTLDIKFVLENSCGKFDRFDISADNKSFNVKLITKYEGCNCNLQFVEASTTFDINLDFPGTYEFNFWQEEGNYDTRSVTIFE